MSRMALDDTDVERDNRHTLFAKRQALIDLARFLPPDDRALAMAFLEHGHSVAALALLAGQPRLKMRRRINGLVRRLTSREYGLAVRHLSALNPAEQEWVSQWIFGGRSMRAQSASRGQSLHSVRMVLRRLRRKLDCLEADAQRGAAR